MSEYYVTNDGELYHYGVKGMRWGVRRNTKLLNSSDSAKRDKAAKALQKHREKGSAQIEKLKKKGVKLEKSYEKSVIGNQTRAAKLSSKAARMRRKAIRAFVPKYKRDSLLYKANVLEIKANDLIARTNAAKARVDKNKTMIGQFEREINNIDQALVERGKKYLKDD